MDGSAHIISLAGLKPIARGGARNVWDRPGHSDQVLKTIRRTKRRRYEQHGALRRVLDDLRLGPYGTFKMEYKCYLRAAYKCDRSGLSIPIAEIGGLVLTDLGMAQVCEKITDLNGGLAKTLSALLAHGQIDKERLQWLNHFSTTLYALNLNVPDLKPANVVLDEARERFVLIDGFGDKTALPVRSWSKLLNQRQLDVRFSEMTQSGLLHWDVRTKTFSI